MKTMENNYTSRLCCSELNKHLINTICRDKLLIAKPDLIDVKVSENMILTSMIKSYTGHITLKEFEEEFLKKKKR